ncbi:GH25 family lysozyme [Leuconostocaceae bacterium ESL0958]|nr:GH25 family lysozyme [Leuconostocaceae bacterium ESL0958]
MNLRNSLLTLAAVSAFGVAGTAISQTHRADAQSIASVNIGDSTRPPMDVVDVSSHQGHLSVADFENMKSKGVRGVIVKITEETSYHNPYAKEQIDNAKAAGLRVSVYHFSRYSNQDEARAEANYFADYASQLGLSSNDLLVDDLEANETKTATTSDNARAFHDQLVSRGFNRVGLYTYQYYITSQHLDTSFVDNKMIWIASYPYEPSSQDLWHRQYGMWQWTSNAHIPGINGSFDMSVDYEAMASDVARNHDNDPADKASEAKSNADTADQPKNTWQDQNGHRIYLGNDGRPVQGWQTIDGKRYYFDNNHAMQLNTIVTDNGQQMQLDDQGVAHPWSGYIYDGSAQNGGYRWYENGQLYTGFRYYAGTYYWFMNGVRQNQGFRQAWGMTYYTDENGRAVQGVQTINGQKLNFGQDGTYYLRSTGYLYDGSDQNGGYRWYEKGKLFTGFRYYAGTYYWFIDGVRQNQGWREAWGMKYYTDQDGRAVQGLQNIDGKSYYFGDNGTYNLRINAVVTANGQQYTADADGVLQPHSGYIYDGSSENGGYRWYENGQLYTGFRYYAGTYYWFVNGVRQNQGWREAWGMKYYTDQDGRAVQGQQTIDGQTYNFGSDGTYYLR